MNRIAHKNSDQGQVNAASNVVVQARLQVGAVNDPLEREADEMADKVMRMPESGLIQRKCAHCKEEDKVQRKSLTSFIQSKGGFNSGMVASDSVSNRINASKGKGTGIPSSTKSFMETRFGTEFSDVNIHTGREATELSQNLGAKAFTVSNDIYFNLGQYAPDTSAGKQLLAHELTHTVQQSSKKNEIQRSPGSPAGGCGACYGSPMLVGRVAHSFVQEAFQVFYPNMLTEHHILSVLPEAANFSRGFLDLAILESYDQIAIGEIKPANPAGLAEGAAKLALYQTALEALGMRVRRLDYELPITISFPTFGRGPNCPPLQALQVLPPVNGVYTYSCEPDFSVIRRNCSCTHNPLDPIPVSHPVEERRRVPEVDHTPRNVAIATGGAVATVGAGYLIYRGIRMLPSFAPPLWPTIPANLAIP